MRAGGPARGAGDGGPLRPGAREGCARGPGDVRGGLSAPGGAEEAAGPRGGFWPNCCGPAVTSGAHGEAGLSRGEGDEGER